MKFISYKYLFIILTIILLIYNVFKYLNTEDNLEKARFYHRQSDGKNALIYYHKCIYDNNYFVLIDIAKIYNYGLNNIDKNIYLANKYYLSFLNFNKKFSTIESRKYETYVRNKLDQIKIENDKHIKLEDKNKKINNEINSFNDINEYLTRNILENFDNKTLFKNQQITQRIMQPINQNINMVGNILPIPPVIRNVNAVVNAFVNAPANPVNVILPPIYNDDNYDVQNVHDTYINKTVRKSIENIKKDTIIKYDFNEVERIFNDEILKLNLNKNKSNNIKMTLERIKTDNNRSVYNNITLNELFTLIGNRILNSDDEDYRNTGINNIALELNECVEYGRVVCNTGIFNRLLNSLNFLDDKVNVKSTNTLNDEMMNKCSRIRQIMIDNDINENDNNFDDMLKQRIRYELEKDYVDSNIITQEELDNIVNVWIDYI